MREPPVARCCGSPWTPARACFAHCLAWEDHRWKCAPRRVQRATTREPLGEKLVRKSVRVRMASAVVRAHFPGAKDALVTLLEARGSECDALGDAVHPRSTATRHERSSHERVPSRETVSAEVAWSFPFPLRVLLSVSTSGPGQRSGFFLRPSTSGISPRKNAYAYAWRGCSGAPCSPVRPTNRTHPKDEMRMRKVPAVYSARGGQSSL